MTYPYVKNYSGLWLPGAGGGTPITAAALNNLETQYDDAKSYADATFNIPSSSILGAMRFPIWWSGLSTSLSGGTATLVGGQVSLATTTNAQYAYASPPSNAFYPLALGAKHPSYIIYISLSSVASNTASFQVGYPTQEADGASSYNYFGIQVINGALYAVSADGANKSSLSLSTNLSANNGYLIKATISQRLSPYVGRYISQSGQNKQSANIRGICCSLWRRTRADE